MDGMEATFALIGAGFLFFGIGFHKREHSWGVAMISIGVICMLSTLAHKVYITLN